MAATPRVRVLMKVAQVVSVAAMARAGQLAGVHAEVRDYLERLVALPTPLGGERASARLFCGLWLESGGAGLPGAPGRAAHAPGR